MGHRVPPDAPFLPAYSLDTGIRLDSNTRPGRGPLRRGQRFSRKHSFRLEERLELGRL